MNLKIPTVAVQDLTLNRKYLPTHFICGIENKLIENMCCINWLYKYFRKQ